MSKYAKQKSIVVEESITRMALKKVARCRYENEEKKRIIGKGYTQKRSWISEGGNGISDLSLSNQRTV